MRTSHLRRGLVALLGGVIAATGLTAAATPAQAAFTSTVGGDIYRSEVMERAQYWLDHQPGPYTTDGSGYSPDPTGSRNYRRDCSGYVDMAWHLNSDNTTYNLAAVSNAISRSDLRPGDVLNDEQHHVILFKQWSNSGHTAIDYYSFGSTPVKLKTNIALTADFDTHPNSEYVARRYIHIKDDVAAPAPTFNGITGADFNGDGKADIAGIDANKNLQLYSGTGAGALSGGNPQMWPGSGLWAGFHGIVAGDFNGDGKTDIAGIDANNNMQLWKGTGTGALTGGSPQMLSGSGLWAGFHGIVAGDFNGDGKTDIAGIDANNNMQLYTGNGAGLLSGGSPQMWPGSGAWANFQRIVAGDFNGDGKTDIAGIDANNNMQLYPGTGTGTLTGGSPQMLSGSGLWVNFHGIAAGDFNGDGKTDIAGIDANNNMQLYTGTGTGLLSAGNPQMWPGSGAWAGF